MDRPGRQAIYRQVIDKLEDYYRHSRDMSVAPPIKEKEVKKYVRSIDLKEGDDPGVALNKIIEGLRKYAVHTPHPGYFGLYNPRTSFLSQIADLITAVFNPQMAAWSHAPFANEVERYIVEAYGVKMGYAPESVDGTFCTAGAESNLTALQCALNHHFPTVSKTGVLNLDKRPRIYCSSESHHSIVKAARTIGLGSDSVREIAVGPDLKMDLVMLTRQIENDQSDGLQPFLVVATAGTTGAGVIDDINKISDISRTHNLWLHVDAAFGGGAIASSSYASILEGIEKSDSIMVDLHKWFSVPMATSLFLTRHKRILHQTYNIQTKYMPPDGDQVSRIDPYIHSLQWSRRFNGLRIFLPLAVYGWEGFDTIITRHIHMGNMLREKLVKKGWLIKNHTQLPVLNITHPRLVKEDLLVHQVVDHVVRSGVAWVSVYPVNGKATIRACITNYATDENDLNRLVEAMQRGLEQLK